MHALTSIHCNHVWLQHVHKLPKFLAPLLWPVVELLPELCHTIFEAALAPGCEELAVGAIPGLHTT